MSDADSFCTAELPGKYEPCGRPATYVTEDDEPVCILHDPRFQAWSVTQGFTVRPSRAKKAG